MKKLLLGTVALAALGAGATANAADLGVRRAVVAAPVAYTNWTGCHVGGAVGNEWGNHDGFSATGGSTAPGFAVPPGSQITPSFSMNGFTGGFYGGCDYQVGFWVFGIEGDWSNVNKEGQAREFTGPPVFGSNFFESAKERWYATVRGRLGYAVDRWMFYVTGGGAWARIDSAEFNILQPQVSFALQTDTRNGWVVGAGLEYGLAYGWSVRSEYLYLQIPSYTTFSNNLFVPAISIINQNTGKLTNNIWRAGLTYKFGYYGAPVAAAVTK